MWLKQIFSRKSKTTGAAETVPLPTSGSNTVYRSLCEFLPQVLIRTLLPLQEMDSTWSPKTLRLAHRAVQEALSPLLPAQLASDPTLVEKFLAVGLSGLGHPRVRRLGRIAQRSKAIQAERETLQSRRISLLGSITGTSGYTEPIHARNNLRQERNRIINLLVPVRSRWLRLQIKRGWLLFGSYVLYAGEYLLTAGSFWPHMPGDDFVPYVMSALLALPTVLLLHYAAKTVLYPALVRLTERLKDYFERDHAWRHNRPFATVTPPQEVLPTEKSVAPTPEARFWRQETALARWTLAIVLGLVAYLGILQSTARGDHLASRASTVSGILLFASLLVCLLAIAAESLRQKAQRLSEAQDAPEIQTPLTELTRQFDAVERQLALLHAQRRTFERISRRETHLIRKEAALHAQHTRQLAAFRPTFGMRQSLKDLASQVTRLTPQVTAEHTGAVNRACREVFLTPDGLFTEAQPMPSAARRIIPPFDKMSESRQETISEKIPHVCSTAANNGAHP